MFGQGLDSDPTLKLKTSPSSPFQLVSDASAHYAPRGRCPASSSLASLPASFKLPTWDGSQATKLYAFSKKVHDAGKSIELVSQDIAATGAILNQLGEELKKDEENAPACRLGTQGLIDAASRLVDECQTLFKEIDQGVTGEQGSKVILGFKHKLKWSYLEPRVDLLRTNLERQKSSLALMLNVLVYAEQQRSQQGASVLREQQKLVASFAEQKNDSEKRVEELKRRIEPPAPVATPTVTKLSTQTAADTVTPSTDRHIASSPAQKPTPVIHVASASTMAGANVSAVQIPDISALPARIPRKALAPRASVASSGGLVPDEPSKAAEQGSQLDHHRLLIDNILKKINSSKYALDHGLRYRLHNGVLELHWREWEPVRATHGYQKLLAILSRSPLLTSHWNERAIKPTVLSPIPGDSMASLVSENSQAALAGTWKPQQMLDSYVTSLRKSHATTWCDRHQVIAGSHAPDARPFAQERFQRIRTSEVSAIAISAESSAIVHKVRHGGVPATRVYVPISIHANPGVPLRLSGEDISSGGTDTSSHDYSRSPRSATAAVPANQTDDELLDDLGSI